MDNSYIPYYRTYEYQKPYLKRYYETHGEKIRAKLQQKITCECGAVIKLASQCNHLNSQKHQSFMKTLDICVSI